MTKLDHALALAALGLHVFPLLPKEKRAYSIRTGTDWWGCVKGSVNPFGGQRHHLDYYHNATTNPAQIRAWWTAFPDADVGIALWPDEVEFDVDGQDGRDALADLEGRLGPLPRGAMVSTGREGGGCHILVRLSPAQVDRGIIFKTGGIVPHTTETNQPITLKTWMNFCVGPGSTHKSSREYAWVNQPADRDAIPYLPEAWCDWLVKIGKLQTSTCRPGRPEAKPARPAPQKTTPSKPRSTPYKPKVPDLDDAIGGIDETLDVIIARYSIFRVNDRGNRHQRTLDVVSFLFNGGRDRQTVVQLGKQWLAHFASDYKASFQAAVSDLLSTVKRYQTRLANGEAHLAPDHQLQSVQLELPRQAFNWLVSFVSRADELAPGTGGGRVVITFCDLCLPVQCFNHLNSLPLPPRLSLLDKGFLLTLLVHVNYELTTKGWTGTVLMTDRQLMRIYKELTGKKLFVMELQKLKRRWFTRDTVATRTELVVRLENGDFGTASSYKLTGLLEAFGLEPVTEQPLPQPPQEIKAPVWQSWLDNWTEEAVVERLSHWRRRWSEQVKDHHQNCQLCDNSGPLVVFGSPLEPQEAVVVCVRCWFNENRLDWAVPPPTPGLRAVPRSMYKYNTSKEWRPWEEKRHQESLSPQELDALKQRIKAMYRAVGGQR